MYKEPLSDSKGVETKYSHDTKLEYCEYRYKTLGQPHSVDKFQKWLTKKAKNMKIKPEKIASARQISSNWFARWDYDKCAVQYIEDKLKEDRPLALQIYQKDIIQNMVDDAEALDKYKKRRRLIQDGKVWFENQDDKDLALQRIEKNINTIETRNRTRAGLPNTYTDNKHDIFGAITVNQQKQEFTPEEMKLIESVSSEPDEETKKFLEEI